MQSIQWLQAQMDQAPLEGNCEAKITLTQSAGAVTCQSGADLNRVSAALNSFLLGAQAGAIPSEVCLTLHDRRIDWTPCPSAAEDKAPSAP